MRRSRVPAPAPCIASTIAQISSRAITRATWVGFGFGFAFGLGLGLGFGFGFGFR